MIQVAGYYREDETYFRRLSVCTVTRVILLDNDFANQVNISTLLRDENIVKLVILCEANNYQLLLYPGITYAHTEAGFIAGTCQYVLILNRWKYKYTAVTPTYKMPFGEILANKLRPL